ncbi:MAG: hypothetical protein NDI82_05135 [Anaeromyxobacteraceae bacterium]|nr:hypothetical protein [Anaeromyxobacteraceae bacterium]
MVEPTFSTTTIAAALAKLLDGEEAKITNALYLAKSRGSWPIEEGDRGWTRYSLADATRLYVQLALRRQGLALERATHLARAQNWWPALGEQFRFLVATEGEPEFAREKDVADRLTEEGGFGVVVDVKAATARLKAALAELGEPVDLPDHSPAAVRARKAREQRS